MDLFKFKNSDDTEKRGHHIRTIKQWVMRHLEVIEESSIFITELQCSEPGCPPVETLVAVMHEREKRAQYKIHKPLLDVTQSDIQSIHSHCHTGR